ncbi:flocculation protein FLO11-like [Sinocyclocheilus rhinocerous]|uniref:flocculation protein FLO11-like n=1 Tax=Sinocyclocheilus rhinocerous TaxID=307959 RepID=UPI0007B958A8|nr:PREDICTED: flocculation protein FLO11-like [Sinocyclocheilus rhinocerous]
MPEINTSIGEKATTLTPTSTTTPPTLVEESVTTSSTNIHPTSTTMSEMKITTFGALNTDITYSTTTPNSKITTTSRETITTRMSSSTLVEEPTTAQSQATSNLNTTTFPGFTTTALTNSQTENNPTMHFPTSTAVLGKTSLPLMNRTGSALVTSKLQFNSASPVPRETQVLSVINTLLKSRDSQPNKSVQVLNVTYKNISETSYAIIFTFNLIDISIPEDPELKNNTYQHLQNVINNVLNTLLNEPGRQVFKAKSSKFKCTENHIEGSMEYIFNSKDQPTILLKELNLQNSLITTTLAKPGTSTTTKETTTLIGRVIFYIRLIFITRGPIPSESHVQHLVNLLLAPHLRAKQDTAQTLNDPVSYVNASYEKIADNSYALKCGFEINSPSMGEKLELRDGNYTFIQNSIKRKLNQILSDSDTSVEFNKANFTKNSMEVIADIDYIFRQQDIKSPSDFLQGLLKVMNSLTTPAPTYMLNNSSSNRE